MTGSMKLLSSLSPLFSLMYGCRTTAFVLKKPTRSYECLRIMSAPKNIALEVEQKFALDENGSLVEARLKELGFRKNGEVDMEDWYFDTPDPHWTLTPRDCWLRCRQTHESSTWQLKRGRRHQDGATIYEELEGEEAIEASISMLPDNDVAVVVPEEYEGRAVPKFPRSNVPLIPFSLILTHRSSWGFSGESEAYKGLTVDLDGTQYGYMVGEVEAVVYNNEDVPPAKDRINSLIREIVPEQNRSGPVPVGKLEHYLIRHRPDHYRVCVEGGSIPER
jgi:thiamine-triphosphatase